MEKNKAYERKFWKKIYIIIAVLFFLYLFVILSFPYSNEVVPCDGGVTEEGKVICCTPERPPAHPTFYIIHRIVITVLVIPTYPILIPPIILLNTVIDTSGRWASFTLGIISFIIWIAYFVLFGKIYLHFKKRKKRRKKK